jgi:hypothetical protein
MFDWQTFLITSIPWAIFVGLLIYFVKNPEKAEKWYSIIARGLSFISLNWEKSGVARDIQSDINSFMKNINSKTKHPVLRYEVKVKWISGTTREAFVKKGKVIVKMEHHKNQAKNFLYITMDWVGKSLIPEGRHLIDKTILRALDFACINKVLVEKKRYDVRQLFLDEFYELEAPKGSLLEKYCSAFDKLDERGLLIGVVLPEFSSLGRRIGSIIPSEKIKLETIGFMSMLEKLSKRMPGEDVNPDYNGENIKCSIVLVARQETYLTHGLSPYLSHINRCCQDGIRSFYVCAIGDANISLVKKIKDSYAESKKISVVSAETQALDRKKSIALHLETKNNQSQA